MKSSLIGVLAIALFAIAGNLIANGGVCQDCCPSCGHKYCVPEPEVTKIKKHCWEVEYKDICIPRFKWPWECCCAPPSCARVRTVKVLKKKEYECEKCGYKWHVQTVCDCPIGGNVPCGVAPPVASSGLVPQPAQVVVDGQ